MADDEQEIFSTFGARPATLQVGAGQLAPSLESRLLGLQEGQRAAFDLGPGEAYGERSQELVRTLSRATFDRNADPETEYQPGDVVALHAPDGARYAGVLKERDRGRVVVDFNHPLAGRQLRFTVLVIGVI
jgi:FKBP-type peptidyl-prolyl cis-trans isomerase SlpA